MIQYFVCKDSRDNKSYIILYMFSSKSSFTFEILCRLPTGANENLFDSKYS
uniref:Uncharacterized protein n=1 Tax=Lepeophtheirus salmonis TaxID=72036 RepID=A0A0K2T6A3_LEPSM